MSAVFGGTQSLHTNSFDEALGESLAYTPLRYYLCVFIVMYYFEVLCSVLFFISFFCFFVPYFLYYIFFYFTVWYSLIQYFISLYQMSSSTTQACRLPSVQGLPETPRSSFRKSLVSLRWIYMLLLFLLLLSLLLLFFFFFVVY